MTLRPRSDEIVDSIAWSFQEFIVPELRDDYAISVAHTIVNLLRHLSLRVDLEPSALYVGYQETRDVLRSVIEFTESCADPDLAELAQRTRDRLISYADGGVGYPPMSRVVDDAAGLRAGLDDAIRTLDRVDDSRRDEAYLELRREIRSCIARQLERESEWIEPAFAGVRR